MPKSDKIKTTIFHLLWVWWSARNKANVGEEMLSQGEIEHRVQNTAAYLRKINPVLQNTVQSSRSVRKGNTWKAPPLGILKINFDGAYREMSRDGSSCFVIRGENGQGVLAGSGRLPMVSDALMAEAEACLAAHEAAIDHGISRVIIESDCLNLVSALKSDEFDRSARGIVFRELRLLLSIYFIVTDIRHVRRSCNACADALAHMCLDRDPEQSNKVSVFLYIYKKENLESRGWLTLLASIEGSLIGLFPFEF